MSRYLIVLLLLLVGENLLTTLVLCSSSFYSSEKNFNTIDNGQNVITEVVEKKFNSDSSSQPIMKRTVRMMPSRNQHRSANEMIANQQVLTNMIGVGLEEPSFNEIRQPHHYSRHAGSLAGRQRGFISRARTVESPARSVDTGGSTSSSIAKEVAKLLNVSQGHYASLYDKIDGRNKLAPTKRPAEAIEESMRNAVQSLFTDERRNRRISGKS